MFIRYSQTFIETMPNLLDWGSVTWWWLHMRAGAYPDTPTKELRDSLTKFMGELPYQLPCSICGMHLQEYIAKNPVYPHTETREKFERYIYNLHEDVNRRKGKPGQHEFEEVQKVFRSMEPWKQWGGYPIVSREDLAKGAFTSEENLTTSGTNTTTSTTVIILSALTVIFAVSAIGLGIALAINLKRSKNDRVYK